MEVEEAWKREKNETLCFSSDPIWSPNLKLSSISEHVQTGLKKVKDTADMLFGSRSMESIY